MALEDGGDAADGPSLLDGDEGDVFPGEDVAVRADVVVGAKAV